MLRSNPAVLTNQDFRFQFRSGIHPVYLGVSVFYIIVLRLLPAEWMKTVFPAVILTDPAIIGFIFIGAILFFEKDQGIFPLLSVSPVTIRNYLISKVISLSLVAAGSSVLIALAVLGLSANYIALTGGAVLTSALVTLAGVWLALKFKNVGSFLILSGGIDIPIILPLVSTFGFWDSPILFILPSRGSLVFLEAASGTPQSPAAWIAGSLSLLIWMIPAWIGAEKSLRREFSLLPGDRNE